jgi:hypothetical protein
MAHFYGWLKGSRGETTRCGTRSSGIWAKVQSWKTRAQVEIHDNDGVDRVIFNVNTDCVDTPIFVCVNNKELVLFHDRLQEKHEHIVEEL